MRKIPLIMLVLSNFELRSAFYRPYFLPSNCFELATFIIMVSVKCQLPTNTMLFWESESRNFNSWMSQSQLYLGQKWNYNTGWNYVFWICSTFWNHINICAGNYKSGQSKESKKKEKWVYRLFCIASIHTTIIWNHFCRIVEIESSDWIIASLNRIQFMYQTKNFKYLETKYIWFSQLLLSLTRLRT